MILSLQNTLIEKKSIANKAEIFNKRKKKWKGSAQ